MAFAEAYEQDGEEAGGVMDEEWCVKVIKAAHGFANKFCGTPSRQNLTKAISVLKQVERARRVLDCMKLDNFVLVREAYAEKRASPERYSRRMPDPPPDAPQPPQPKKVQQQDKRKQQQQQKVKEKEKERQKEKEKERQKEKEKERQREKEKERQKEKEKRKREEREREKEKERNKKNKSK